MRVSDGDGATTRTAVDDADGALVLADRPTRLIRREIGTELEALRRATAGGEGGAWIV